jgi:hypothetical protein
LKTIHPNILEHLRSVYTPGTRVVLIKMNDPYTKLTPGTKGTVTGVDDIGTIHVNWDSGSSLGVAYGEDSCRKIEEKNTHIEPEKCRKNCVQ